MRQTSVAHRLFYPISTSVATHLVIKRTTTEINHVLFFRHCEKSMMGTIDYQIISPIEKLSNGEITHPIIIVRNGLSETNFVL